MTARAALATGAILAGTVTAHIWAGGELPSVGWIALIGALVFAATRAVFRGRVSAPVMVLGLGVAQLGVHALLTAMTVQPDHLSGSHHHVASGSVGPDMLSIGWQMAAAHALSAGLTVLFWSVMAGALEEILELADQPSLAVGERYARLMSDADRVVRVAVAGWRSGAPRRGPPRAPSPQSA